MGTRFASSRTSLYALLATGCGLAAPAVGQPVETVTVEAAREVKMYELNKIGIGIDFRDLKKALKEITGRLDHQYLNDLPEFKKVNPTSENIAKFIYKELKIRLKVKKVKVASVTTSESASTRACYREE